MCYCIYIRFQTWQQLLTRQTLMAHTTLQNSVFNNGLLLVMVPLSDLGAIFNSIARATLLGRASELTLFVCLCLTHLQWVPKKKSWKPSTYCLSLWQLLPALWHKSQGSFSKKREWSLTVPKALCAGFYWLLGCIVNLQMEDPHSSSQCLFCILALELAFLRNFPQRQKFLRAGKSHWKVSPFKNFEWI